MTNEGKYTAPSKSGEHKRMKEKKICFLQELRTNVAWVLQQSLHERATKEGESRLEVTEISDQDMAEKYRVMCND